MIELTSKQRKVLEKAAHHLEPVVLVGGAGVTDALVSMVDKCLSAHELIKVKFNEYKEEKQELSKKIEAETDSTLVRIIGNIATFYRAKDEILQRKYEKLLQRV
jgi:RNA-binding protein